MLCQCPGRDLDHLSDAQNIVTRADGSFQCAPRQKYQNRSTHIRALAETDSANERRPPTENGFISVNELRIQIIYQRTQVDDGYKHPAARIII